MRRLVPLAALLVLPACGGLPLPDGVQSAGEVRAEQQGAPEVRVIPPGPQPGATADEIVRGFLRAQGTEVAREFLSPEAEWDEQGAVVYDGRAFVPDGDSDPLTFAVRFDASGRISGGGGFSLVDEQVLAGYTVARMPDGEYRLTTVPGTVHVPTTARDRTFEPYDVYFLARGLDGASTARLVPDRVFLPATAERPGALVTALLDGPTVPLQPVVQTAVPPGTRLASPVSEVDGVVTVDLTPEVLALGARERQRLAAQLVWTLGPDYSGVRLLVAGEPLDVEGAGAVQTREDWAEYDPARLGPDAPLYYVQDRRVEVLDGTLPSTEATTAGGVAVDEVAVSPVGGALGLLTEGPELDEVRTGPAGGPFGAPVLQAPDLGSLSWGPGEQGLWVLERAATPVVHLLPGPGSAVQERVEVPYERPPGAGPLSALRVSRDGARAALVFGTGEGRRLYVAQIQPTDGRLRIANPTPVAPSLRDVADVAWRSGTALDVLASSDGSQVVVWTVVVDGSTRPAAVQRPGLPGGATSLAAAPGQPLVVSAVVDGRSQLFREDGTLFRLLEEQGTAPVYPG